MQTETKNSKPTRKLKTVKKDAFSEEIVAFVTADFERRQNQRLAIERQWELNVNFLSGNQYCDVNSRGEITQEDKRFYWQNKRVFNHIAPIIETRLAKFSRISPTVFVRPKSDSDKDMDDSVLAQKFIDGAFKRSDLESVVKKVTTWSETCGTGFYKIVWDNQGGNNLGELNGQKVYEGDVKIIAVSPFEIFPDSIYADKLSDCDSLIHARAVSVKRIKEKYGVDVVGESIGVFNLDTAKRLGVTDDSEGGKVDNSAVVIERYERPSQEFPNGRLITVCQDKLLYYGELPYLNGKDKRRDFPFVKQDCINVPGNFFGTSVIERLIPVQRAFNAVKNRKHEFLNRLSMGVMTVEDGSLDTDDLAEEGLSPGKVLVYRQGAKAPEMMEGLTMPTEFSEEESKLINEFVIISGVPDASTTSEASVIRSSSALEIMVEQDNERLVFSAENVRLSYLEIARQTVRLYSQFLTGVRPVKYQDEFNKTKILYADKNVLESDDVYLDSENEMLYTHAQKKDMIFRLYQSGLLNDDNGSVRPSVKEKILTLLGYKDLDCSKGLSKLQEEKARRENDKLKQTELSVEDFDDDSIHVDEHLRFVLSEYQSLNDQQKQRFSKHIKEHKEKVYSKQNQQKKAI